MRNIVAEREREVNNVKQYDKLNNSTRPSIYVCMPDLESLTEPLHQCDKFVLSQQVQYYLVLSKMGRNL